jgi:hypothetical protein
MLVPLCTGTISLTNIIESRTGSNDYISRRGLKSTRDRYFIRKAFTATEGKSLIVSDYGQLELRLLAHMAKCQSMMTAFELGGDFHSRTALGMYPNVKNAVQSGACLLEWDYRCVAHSTSFNQQMLKRLNGVSTCEDPVWTPSLKPDKTPEQQAGGVEEASSFGNSYSFA